MKRAYALFTIKAVDDEARVIEGMATTPTPDRLGDIVEPMGAEFELPLPLLWQHRSSEPIGHVEWAKPTKAGIQFRARFAKISEAGRLKDRIDEAWQSVKHQLVRGVSIGFSSIEHAYMDKGAVHFIKWAWLELSVVTIPANQEATIEAIKSLDRQQRSTASKAPPASKGKTAMRSTAEKIQDLEGQIAPKRARMKALHDVADNDNREMDEGEIEEFDTIADEVKGLETKLGRLRVLEGSEATVKAVRGDDPSSASSSRASRLPAQVAPPAAEKGLGFARLVSCYAMAKGDPVRALAVAKQRYANARRSEIVQMDAIFKAQIAGADSLDPSWAAPFVEQTLISEFVEFLRPLTIIGKFGTNGIPSLHPIPFNVKFNSQTADGTGFWVGEGKAIGVTRASFAQSTLRWTKVANIAVLSNDLIRFSSPSAELAVRKLLADALIKKMDSDFVNPSITETADVRPASVFNGAQTYVSGGVDAEAVRADVKRLLAYFIANDIPTATAVWLMRQGQASSLSLMRNALGQPEFPGISINGGTFEGLPTIVSQYVPQGVVGLVVADEVFLADDGGVSIDMSTEASIEMADNPTNAITDNASPPQPVEQQMVSMWQTESTAIKAARVINWKKRRTAASVYQTSTGWGNADTSPAQAAI